MTGIREDWFPTSIWYFDHPDCLPLNERLRQLIHQERVRDTAGMEDRSHVLGWHSQDDLHLRAEFAPFVTFVRDSVSQVNSFYKWDHSRVEPVMANCWAIVNKQHASNKFHNHPHSVLSGVYYVCAPENCGNLVFRDPREVQLMTAPPVSEYSPWTFKTVHYEPISGRLVIFPSWLYHGVEPNLSADERVCLSFNVGLHWKQGARRSPPHVTAKTRLTSNQT